MPGNVDYILGGAGTIAQGVGSMLEQQKLAEQQNRQVHPAIEQYARAVLSGQMTPFEAATRAKLEMEGERVLSSQAPITGAKPTLPPLDGGSMMASPPAGGAPQGSLLSGAPPMSTSPQSMMQRPTGAPLQVPQVSRQFTLRDLEDLQKLAPFYQSQQALQRAEEVRRSVEAEGQKGRTQRDILTNKRLATQERIAGAATSQRAKAAQLSFEARMAAINAMERASRSRSTTAKDVATFLEEGRNLRAERANIARELAAAAQAFGPPSQTQAVVDDAQRRLKELSKLESKYEPIRQRMLERSGLSEYEFDRTMLAPLVESETETETRSTPAGFR